MRCVQFLAALLGLATWLTPARAGMADAGSPEPQAVLGTWFDKSQDCTLSIEQAGRQLEAVWRCKDTQTQGAVRSLARNASGAFVPQPPDPHGLRYVRMESGELVIRDDEGLIRTLPVSAPRWADPRGRTDEASTRQSATALRSCYEIGYRFGFAAAGALRGWPGNPAWSEAPPPRCADEASTERGMRDGALAAR